MAETLIIKDPQFIKIENKSDLVKTFVPYRENFVTNLPKKTSIVFSVKNAGQVLYYLNQATDGLVVTQEASLVEGTTQVSLPAKITLENTTKDMVKTFVPYKENFTVDIAATDKVELIADTFGQVLYYLAQATDGLEVKQAANA